MRRDDSTETFSSTSTPATPFSPCFSPLENLPSSSSSSSFSGTSLKLSKKVIVKSTHPPPPQTFRKKKRIPGSLKKFIENTETSTLSSSDTTISISSSSSDAPVVVIAAANRQADHEQQILDLKTQLHLQATKLVSCQEYIESETARHDAEIKELKIEFLQSQLKCATALGELEDAKEMNQQLNYTIKLLMKSMNNISCSNSLTKFQASTLEEKGNGDIKDDFVPSLTPSLPLAVAKKRHRKPKHSDIPMAAE